MYCGFLALCVSACGIVDDGTSKDVESWYSSNTEKFDAVKVGCIADSLVQITVVVEEQELKGHCSGVGEINLKK